MTRRFAPLLLVGVALSSLGVSLSFRVSRGFQVQRGRHAEVERQNPGLSRRHASTGDEMMSIADLVAPTGDDFSRRNFSEIFTNLKEKGTPEAVKNFTDMIHRPNWNRWRKCTLTDAQLIEHAKPTAETLARQTSLNSEALLGHSALITKFEEARNQHQNNAIGLWEDAMEQYRHELEIHGRLDVWTCGTLLQHLANANGGTRLEDVFEIWREVAADTSSEYWPYAKAFEALANARDSSITLLDFFEEEMRRNQVKPSQVLYTEYIKAALNLRNSEGLERARDVLVRLLSEGKRPEMTVIELIGEACREIPGLLKYSTVYSFFSAARKAVLPLLIQRKKDAEDPSFVPPLGQRTISLEQQLCDRVFAPFLRYFASPSEQDDEPIEEIVRRTTIALSVKKRMEEMGMKPGKAEYKLLIEICKASTRLDEGTELLEESEKLYGPFDDEAPEGEQLTV
uniref:Pentacotripeptide-repeat region of PRORP domain-containing protein n=1 Tax=Chromera velia CCMP2878 TaxID=1169474 RepID=A0A0G4GT86_9ALVE|mmetsp:Transcript_24516/g.48069  ORF Transcript_24516/g.48069 Transcript_24516/m.48069 type:complete len:455 (+) Transcript_24516:63-1427(+)|eukprot:Cvel_23275.t1-p1 / transcript=Cvel_23275.t1 / gene=Cvel_23275 / organism=Chromera_velia_CCMP2878 / gene_product=hypothetical protein / transcript_product=hypothetical protein / location=Cvel_scaffold2380:20871-22673(+) / protein_length=454 / sequence_SO=supercontig / SO=protein_coding / is_pseudo=false